MEKKERKVVLGYPHQPYGHEDAQAGDSSVRTKYVSITVPWLDGCEVDAYDLCAREFVSHGYCPEQGNLRVSEGDERWSV